MRARSIVSLTAGARPIKLSQQNRRADSVLLIGLTSNRFLIMRHLLTHPRRSCEGWVSKAPSTCPSLALVNAYKRYVPGLRCAERHVLGRRLVSPEGSRRCFAATLTPPGFTSSLNDYLLACLFLACAIGPY